MNENKFEYEDIINLPHHQSEKHPHMSLKDRAAQFAPFAALTGFGEVIKSTASLSELENDHDMDREAAEDI